jgi:hypothetical protein
MARTDGRGSGRLTDIGRMDFMTASMSSRTVLKILKEADVAVRPQRRKY